MSTHKKERTAVLFYSTLGCPIRVGVQARVAGSGLACFPSCQEATWPHPLSQLFRGRNLLLLLPLLPFFFFFFFYAGKQILSEKTARFFSCVSNERLSSVTVGCYNTAVLRRPDIARYDLSWRVSVFIIFCAATSAPETQTAIRRRSWRVVDCVTCFFFQQISRLPLSFAPHKAEVKKSDEKFGEGMHMHTPLVLLSLSPRSTLTLPRGGVFSN